MSSQQNLNVLIVDRDEETTLALKDVLSQDGHRVTVLSDLSQVSAEIRENRYQIVGWSEAGAKSSIVHWGKPVSWPPKSKGWIAIYRRNEVQESESVRLLPEAG